VLARVGVGGEACEGVECGVGDGLHAEFVLEESFAVAGDDDVDFVSEFDEV